MGRKIKVLVVEDEVIVAQYLSMELEASGYEVCRFVVTGEEAIQKVKKEEPDLILMDIHLAGRTDGIEAAQKILEYRKIPIIFMTGYSQMEVTAREKNLNPTRFLSKPVEVDKIIMIFEDLKEK
ncbi:MAG: response regulator [Candidatus Aminicenantaceae bacterium]